MPPITDAQMTTVEIRMERSPLLRVLSMRFGKTAIRRSESVPGRTGGRALRAHTAEILKIAGDSGP